MHTDRYDYAYPGVITINTDRSRCNNVHTDRYDYDYIDMIKICTDRSRCNNVHTDRYDYDYIGVHAIDTDRSRFVDVDTDRCGWCKYKHIWIQTGLAVGSVRIHPVAHGLECTCLHPTSYQPMACILTSLCFLQSVQSINQVAHTFKSARAFCITLHRYRTWMPALYHSIRTSSFI
jgi:hypothetical protein